MQEPQNCEILNFNHEMIEKWSKLNKHVDAI